jgi:purine-binding chemotaxis protein CheW
MPDGTSMHDMSYSELAATDEEWDEGLESKRSLHLRRIIAFEMDDELYGADIAEVAEILELVPIMPLPNVPEFVLGVANLRGTILSVIDLRIRFGLGHKPCDDNSRVIVLKADQLVAGIMVDRLWELLRLDQSVFQPPPPDVAKIDPEYFKEVTQVKGRLLIVLDIKRLLIETSGKLQGEGLL